MNKPILYYRNGVFICECHYLDRSIPKDAEFTWHIQPCVKKKCPACAAGLNEVGTWFTDDPFQALALREYADEEAQKVLDNLASTSATKIDQSRATDTNLFIPAPPGLNYLPYQKAGIEFIINRHNTFLADEMGLGKTIQAIGTINILKPLNTLIICPAGIKYNWRNELRRWLIHKYKIDIAEGDFFPQFADIVIINYDIINKHRERIDARQWEILIIDECHYLKNQDSIRKQMVYGSKDIPAIRGTKINLCMTGTPLENRLKDLYTTLHFLDPENWQSFAKFMQTYHFKTLKKIRVKGGREKMVYELGDEKNLDQLQLKLRSTVMIRRLKREVLKELPAKFRQVIPLESGGFSHLLSKEIQRYEQHENIKTKLKELEQKNEAAFRQQVSQLQRAKGLAFAALSEARIEVARAKLPYVVEHVKELLETQDCVVVFALHLEIIAALKNAFDDSVVIKGGLDAKERDKIITQFQGGKWRVLIAQIMNAEGYNAYRASNAVFVELDWRPGKVMQAEDRLHRIGQKSNVHIQHIVFDDSLDSRILIDLIRKLEVAEKALDQIPEELRYAPGLH